MKRIVMLVLLGFMLSGCVAIGPSFKREDSASLDKSVLYVYRPMGLSGIGESYKIWVDGQSIGAIEAGGYYRYEVHPGFHNIGWGAAISSIKHISGKKEFEALSGESTYYRVHLGESGLVKESIALQEISKTRKQSCAANKSLVD